jgi:trans-aconitate 2-methyltransferase
VVRGTVLQSWPIGGHEQRLSVWITLQRCCRSPELQQLGRIWLKEDIRRWNPKDLFDLICSNAALQWIPNHQKEILRLFHLVAKGGALAFQIPTHTDRWFEVLEKMVKSSRWKDRFRERSSDFFSQEFDFYYALLSPTAKRVDLWETKYIHVLPSPDAVVDWTRATALRPLLNLLPDDHVKETFVREYACEITLAYPRERNGKVLFPFLRRFVIAYR